MNNADKKRSVIVGIFVLLGVIILVTGILTLGSQQKAFVKSITLTSVFDNVEGLTAGNNVWFSGVKIGTVKKINFHGNSQVEIEMDIESEVREYIRKDALATISSDGFIGNKIVVIHGGSPAAPPVENQDVLKSESPADMMETLQVNNLNLVAITSDLKKITSQIAGGQGTVGALLSDSSLAMDFRAIVSSLKNTASQSEAVSRSLSRFTGKLNQEGTLVNDLLSDTTLYNNLQSAVSQLEAVSVSAAAITKNLEGVSTRLESNNNAIGMLLTDEKVAGTLKSTLENLESSTEKLDENMEALRHNFLFRRYFKNKSKEEAAGNQ
ncbi:phospholipid/cholesterol/gamma-HCH transport system substrate-binding protein [Anseongella ginsenosidimutans]|uniref:Phospholipid/cholesterol/gamma-HCH transport system substrate-binding protein n=1 Tax=Anseongella ginsenosidimutans TaxID=496056 RepID=A0A4R3KUC8_9SPHI|nr:MlaD family protein [Anseongella ginsenosidimutans]QEC53379.1 MCE family protein [Anseongella ginsenosidimutans]TCS88265.1 phospholipid/cholesterol/gamma-HCH transport system substrate-binding protein [Anseongella ginsenosidimutans]